MGLFLNKFFFIRCYLKKQQKHIKLAAQQSGEHLQGKEKAGFVV